MEQSGGGDNVIYVQVDEQGRVLNYTSNMSGGEQVILLQDGGSGQQPLLVDAPSTSGSVISPSQTSAHEEPILVSSNSEISQPTFVSSQEETIQHSTVIEEPIIEQQVSQTQTSVMNQPSVQPTLVDQSGTPVMLIGQPQPVASPPSVVPPSTSLISSISGVGQMRNTLSSQVVDQTGAPVVVLGTPAPKPAPQIAPSISYINRPQIRPQAATTSIVKRSVVQQSLVQRQKVISRFPRASVPGRSVLISKEGKTYLATPKPIGQPGIMTTSQKFGQATKNVLSSPVIRTPSGPVILSAKTQSNLPKAGVSGVVLVSRPHMQISNSPLMLSKQKSPTDTKTSGVITFSPSITVSQPVLTVIKESKPIADTTRVHQTSEVTSTVNGTEDETEKNPIEISESDDEDSTPKETTFPATETKEKETEETMGSSKEGGEGMNMGEEVIQDVAMDVAKEDEKSEEEIIEDQKEQESSDEKTQQDLDSDLLMYLGGDTVKQNEEKGLATTDDGGNKTEEDHTQGNMAEQPVTEEAMEVEPAETENSETVEEEVVENEDELDEEGEANVESTTVSDDEFEDDHDDDALLPAGLIRGEPLQRHQKADDEVEMEKQGKDEKVEDAATEQSGKNDDKPDKDDSGIEKEQEEPLNEEEMDEAKEIEERQDEGNKIVSEEATSTQDDDQESKDNDQDEKSPEEEDATLQEEKSLETTTVEKPIKGKGASRQKSARGKKIGNKKGAADTPEEVHKKSFMAKFNLVSPQEMEKLNQRRSKRVSNAEAVKQKDEDIEPNAATASSKVSSTVKGDGLKKHETPRSYKSYKTLDDESLGRQNIFELFDSKEVDKDDSMDSLKARIQKLLAVNAELKTRLRESDHKAASNQASNARFHEIKALQHKVEKLEKRNSELSQRLESYEGKPSPPERTVDVSFRMGRLSFKSPTGTSQTASSNVPGSSPGKPKLTDGQDKPASAKSKDALEKKEAKLRALDQELDQRTAILKTKEGKLQRLVMDVKSREKKVEYREGALERRVKDIEYRERMLEGKTKAALEKMNKDGGAGGISKRQPEDTVRSAEMKRFEQELVQRKLKEREETLKEREDAVSEKEKYLEVTEKELAALGDDLKEQFHLINPEKGPTGGKLPSGMLAKSRKIDSDKKPVAKTGRKSVGSTSNGKPESAPGKRESIKLDELEVASPVTKQRGKKTVRDTDSESNVSSGKASTVSSTDSAKKVRQDKKTDDSPKPKTPKNLIIDMVDKPLFGRARTATTRRSLGVIGKPTPPKSTLRKRTRTDSPAPITKQKTLAKKPRK